MASKTKQGIDTRLVKAFGHPVRIDVLAILTLRVASPSEVAKELKQGVSHVSYHFKVLKDVGFIELVRTEPRRGAVEHFYRATSKALIPSEIAEQLPKAVRGSISATVCQSIIEEMASALKAGTFDSREDRHLSLVPMTLDEKGWGDLIEMLAQSLDRAIEIQGESASRLAESDEPGLSATVAMLGFESPEGPRKVAARKT